ncbi:phospholipase [Streptomyces toxytricini]|uniref:phospholipase n=1 Tax=Streptomyces toxytricini TaxID=67369 RepID=UPI003F4D866B
MPRRRTPARVAAAAAVAAGVLVLAAPAPAPASAVPADKPQVLSRWTQTGSASYTAWAAARSDPGQWAAYGFDWSTDHCTSSPDNPLGFPFRNACARHDFGYRNYKRATSFPAHKARLDDAFHADMQRVCATYSGAAKRSCEGTAWTYYQAVRAFGVSSQDTPAGGPTA